MPQLTRPISALTKTIASKRHPNLIRRPPLPQARQSRPWHACPFGHVDNARNSTPLSANFFNELWMALIANPLYSLIPPYIPSAKPMVMTSIVIAVRECRPLGRPQARRCQTRINEPAEDQRPFRLLTPIACS
jgi:hypothetical protein